MVAETINPDIWITLKNKFKSKCCNCGEEVEINDTVLWKKGVGVKHEICPDIIVKPQIKEWKNSKHYTYIELQKIEQCQCCGINLNKKGDKFINDEKRVCEDCFLV
jgi:hypothetical protein